MDLLEHNRIAWNNEVKIKNQWTIPVSEEQICLLYTSPSPRD